MFKSVVAVLALAAATSGCHLRTASHDKLSVDRAWVRLAALPGQPAAAYFDMHGGDTDDALMSVSGPLFGAAMFHKTEVQGTASMANMPAMPAMSVMRAIARIDVPAHQDVRLRPGEIHVMLMSPDQSLKAHSHIQLTLHFRGDRSYFVNALAIAAGDPEPDF